MTGRIEMRMLLLGAVGVLAVQVLLIFGAYAMRITPEVVNCDRGRQSVEVEVTKSIRVYETGVFKRELLGCRLWYHGAGALGGD